MKFIIHIGLNKTGTSSLQAFLALNPDNLAARGWVYPKAGSDGAAHHGVAQAVARKSDDLYQILKDMQAEAGAAEGILLSSEALHDTPNVPFLAEALRGHDVKIVIFLRDYLDYLSSWYREDVQSSGLCCDFENYAALKRKTYAPILRRWARAFGPENLLIRDYDRKTLRNGSTVDEILSGIIGLGSLEGWNTVGYENNPSVSGNLLFFKRLVNNFVPRPEAKGFHDQITDIAKVDAAFRGKMAVRPEFGNYIFAAQYRSDVAQMEEEFGFSLNARGGRRDGAPIPDLERMQSDLDLILSECDRRGFDFGALLRRYAPAYLTQS